jgi:hypothetical protein
MNVLLLWSLKHLHWRGGRGADPDHGALPDHNPHAIFLSPLLRRFVLLSEQNGDGTGEPRVEGCSALEKKF